MSSRDSGRVDAAAATEGSFDGRVDAAARSPDVGPRAAFRRPKTHFPPGLGRHVQKGVTRATESGDENVCAPHL